MDPLLILTFVVLFLLSWFFSGTELALMSLPKHKIDSLVKNKRWWANTLKTIKSNNDRLLITILIWNNLVNTYTAALATQIAMQIALKTSSLPEAQIIWISTWIITLLLLLFGEIIPKSFATKNATMISLLVSPIYRILMIVLFPIIVIIEFVIKIFSWKNKIESITWEEIQSFIDLWKEHWGLDDHEHEKIKKVLEFDDTSVEEIMTPRVKIEALSKDTTIKEALEFYLNHTHSRIPIFDKTIDNIDYYLSPRDILREYRSWKHEKKLKELKLKRVLKVPLNQSISKLFDIFRNKSRVFAIVMDEYGWVAGLVTTEDIVEEVFWEIRDETDKETDELVKTWEDSYVVESEILMEDLLKQFDLDLEHIWLDSKEFDGETISYVITNVLWDFPTKDQVIDFQIIPENPEEETSKRLYFKVLEVDNWKIGKIDVKIS